MYDPAVLRHLRRIHSSAGAIRAAKVFDNLHDNWLKPHDPDEEEVSFFYFSAHLNATCNSSFKFQFFQVSAACESLTVIQMQKTLCESWQ